MQLILSKFKMSLTKIIFVSLVSTSIILIADSSVKNILLVGDSISILYAPYLKEYIDDCFNLRLKGNQSDAIINLDNPKGANAGNSRMILDYLKHFKETDVSFNDDIILLNCGLHDIKTDPANNKKAVSIYEYKSNLSSIYQIIKKLNKKLIWINTTPVNDSIHNSKQVGFYRYNKDVENYNSIADSFFTEHNVPIIDLYSFTKSFPKEAYSDHVHFKPKYAQLQAKYIAEFILNKNY